LYLYGGFLALIFVLEIGAGVSIFAYRNKLMQGFDKGLTQSIENYRTEKHEKVAEFDAIQAALHCCGNHNYNDYLNLRMPVPPACCIEPNCDTANFDKIYDQGCYDKVIGFLDSNISTVAGVAIGIAFFPLVGLILSCCLAKVANKAKYEQMA